MRLDEMIKRFRELEHKIETFKEGPKCPSGASYTPVAKATLLVERQDYAFAIARELAKMPRDARIGFVVPTAPTVSIRKAG